eukprot:355752_1
MNVQQFEGQQLDVSHVGDLTSEIDEKSGSMILPPNEIQQTIAEITQLTDRHISSHICDVNEMDNGVEQNESCVTKVLLCILAPFILLIDGIMTSHASDANTLYGILIGARTTDSDSERADIKFLDEWMRKMQ